MFTDPALAAITTATAPAPITRTERAAAHHLAQSWNDQPLHKFSLTRKRLLLEMRAAAGAPPIGRMEALLGDALRWLWLCQLPDAQVEALQSGAGLPLTRDVPLPARMQIACDRWADAQAQLDQGEVVQLFIDAWLASEATLTVSPTSAGDATAGALDLGESRGQ
jgi:hypothetical protein